MRRANEACQNFLQLQQFSFMKDQPMLAEPTGSVA
ncbi:hypothetical protein NB311A_10378 [Nitrobacter sp. Nb-311A]|nr:hypothetical protein NB311A_10378 [Nitrobacter sp. Nb-311A]